MQVQHSPETSPAHSQQLLKPRKPGWRVFLGRAAWSRYTYERPEGDDLKLLGSVSKGAQVGALAMTAEGDVCSGRWRLHGASESKGDSEGCRQCAQGTEPGFVRRAPVLASLPQGSPSSGGHLEEAPGCGDAVACWRVFFYELLLPVCWQQGSGNRQPRRTGYWRSNCTTLGAAQPHHITARQLIEV